MLVAVCQLTTNFWEREEKRGCSPPYRSNKMSNKILELFIISNLSYAKSTVCRRPVCVLKLFETYFVNLMDVK